MIGDVVLYYSRFIILFTQIIHKKQAKNKTLFILWYEKYSSTVQQLAYRSWHRVNRQEELLRRERRWETTELKECQQQEMEGKLQFHSCLTLMEHMFACLKVCDLKVLM